MLVSTAVAIGICAGSLAIRPTAARIFYSLPATAAHELAHWTVALLTGSRPSFPSLWPRRHGTYWELGSVEFSPGPFTAGLVALAPLWCLGPLAYWLWGAVSAQDSYVVQSAQGACIGYLLLGCWPSSQDWAVAVRYPLGTLALLTALYVWLGAFLPPM